MMASKNLHVTLIKSLNGRLKNHKLCAYGLGLRKIGQNRYVLDTIENRGMINKISYLLNVKEEEV